jgi:hypothetical protein
MAIRTTDPDTVIKAIIGQDIIGSATPGLTIGVTVTVSITLTGRAGTNPSPRKFELAGYSFPASFSFFQPQDLGV